MPDEFDGLVEHLANQVIHIVLTITAWKDNHTEFHCYIASAQDELVDLIYELFDHRVGQDALCHLLDFLSCFCQRKICVQKNIEELALPHLLDITVPQIPETVVNCFALRVQHTFLEADKHFRSHSTTLFP